MGGEQVRSLSNFAALDGSSPRGRGTGAILPNLVSQGRFIPAWAGNRGESESHPIPAAVHPRVGGEQTGSSGRSGIGVGSSPRGRGTEVIDAVFDHEVRFIPAWAGNRPRDESQVAQDAVHPRVGGEQLYTCKTGCIPIGSSPRGRGTASIRSMSRRFARFIPAWAGNRLPVIAGTTDPAVHPRVGGEQQRPHVVVVEVRGSSPRGRGTEMRCPVVNVRRRFIPAWAGNRPNEAAEPCSPSVHPRVGGEQKRCGNLVFALYGSSPRGRGTVVMVAKPIQHDRFIPAWAGNSRSATERPIAGPVHPRVGGEQSRSCRRKRKTNGSSPRGRGTAVDCVRPFRVSRFIPAWAGNS